MKCLIQRYIFPEKLHGCGNLVCPQLVCASSVLQLQTRRAFSTLQALPTVTTTLLRWQHAHACCNKKRAALLPQVICPYIPNIPFFFSKTRGKSLRNCCRCLAWGLYDVRSALSELNIQILTGFDRICICLFSHRSKFHFYTKVTSILIGAYSHISSSFGVIHLDRIMHHVFSILFCLSAQTWESSLLIWVGSTYQRGVIRSTSKVASDDFY